MANFKLDQEGQKQLIMGFLQEAPMSVESLAARMLCSPDTVRRRLRELQDETQAVRVVGWDVKGGAVTRMWGVGGKRRHAPIAQRPLQRQRRRVSRSKGEVCAKMLETRRRNAAPPAFRLEPFDRWIFAIRREK